MTQFRIHSVCRCWTHRDSPVTLNDIIMHRLYRSKEAEMVVAVVVVEVVGGDTVQRQGKAFEAIVRIGVLTQPDALSHAMGHWHPVCGLLCGVKSHTKRTSGAAYGKLISCWSLERETSFVATGSKSQALSSPLLRLMGERVLSSEEFHYRRSNPILFPQSMVMGSSSMCNK